MYLKSNETPSIGATIKFTKNGLARISKYVKLGTAAYVAGLEKEDLILSIGNKSFSDLNQFNEVIGKNKVGKKVLVKYKRHGKDKTTWLKIETNPDIVITKYSKPSEKALQKRAAWLGNQELPSESK